MKYILAILLLSTSLFSETFYIKDNFQKSTTASFTEFIKDENRSFSPHQILQLENLHKTENITFIGINRGLYWSRTIFQNISKEPQEFILYNILPEMDFINIYVFRNGNLIENIESGELGKDRETRLGQIKLNLEIGEKLTVVASYENFFLYEIGWTIISLNDFINQENWKLMAFGFFVGAGIVLSIVSLLMFILFRDVSYIFPIIYSNLNLVFHYGFYGLGYQLTSYLSAETISLITWLVPVIITAIDLLYIYFLFDLKHKYEEVSRLIFFLSGIVFLSAIHTAIIYNHGTDYIIVLSANILTFSASLGMLGIGGFGIYLYLKEGGVVKIYFIIAQVIIAIAFAIFTFSFHGIGDFNEEIQYIFPIVSEIYIVFILLAQYTKTKTSIDELKQKKEFILRQSHFSAIGQTIGYVSHQWKSPMTSMGASVSLLETMYRHQKDKFNEHFETQLPKMKESLSFMKGTIDEFTTYFSPNLNDDNVLDLNKTLKNILNILDEKILLKNVKIATNVSHDVKILKSYDHIFSNIFIVFINNSIDEFKADGENRISISVFKNEKGIILVDYLDNAGGIKAKPIESVFEYFVSSKKSGQGLGLPIAKMLVEERLNGKISVQNRDGGANFTVEAKI
ncbi:7TM-containing protein possibly involved in signal transduction,histidine kinase [Thiovulum sp. ES]|nr:7TM-containing protein possibly involved in signal transduction,histidine kinase [Thiovulum sp. ES]